MQCRFCKFTSSSQETLLKHFRLHHGQGAHWPCIHTDCVCVFKTPGALRSHLSRSHSIVRIHKNSTFQCELCDFKEVCSEKTFWTHLGHHLKNRETVQCPFLRCNFKTNIRPTFSSHRSRNHKNCTLEDFRTIARTASEDEIIESEQSDCEAGTSAYNFVRPDELDEIVKDVDCETLEHKLASLFLCMETVLHVSRAATQKIVEDFHNLLSFSNIRTLTSVKEILSKHEIEVNDCVLQDISNALVQTNPLLLTTSEKGPLSTDHRRNIYFKEQFSVVEPTEYLYNTAHKNSFVYISVTKILETLLRRADFLDQIVFNQEALSGHFKSFQDGKYYKGNKLLGQQNLCISLGLYIDDFEVCNPLGTSRKHHKITAVYWVVLNLPPRFRSNLYIMCLEEEGIFVEVVSQFIKGTVYCVSADNLGAHGLAGFYESFTVDKFCRFCLISRDQIATTEVNDFQLRGVDQHNSFLEELRQTDYLQSVNGVKRECVLGKHLLFFHPITGFPPDILHDLFEGIIPLELSLCLKNLISKGFITFDTLNNFIKSFPYKYSDKVNKPQKIPKTSFEKGTVFGNGHENWTLLRLLPFIIGCKIPEQEPAWEILMDLNSPNLKEIVDIVVSNRLTEEALCYLSCKLLDHRLLLTSTFPDFRLRPKHHFIDHYPHLIRCYGPLVELWTMRFEAKHSFFKKVVHDTHNWKNVLLTLSLKHQQMMAYHLDSGNLLKPKLYVDNVKVVRVSELDTSLKCEIQKKYPHLDSVSLSKTVHLFGTQYVAGMILSAGQCSGLPEFHKIVTILVNAEEVTFICKRLSSWYIEHFRSYEVVEHTCADLLVLDPDVLTDYHPLTAYTVGGKLMVTPRTYLLY
ncbi:somatostatin receptor 2 [Sarotherodon galilaeus]